MVAATRGEDGIDWITAAKFSALSTGAALFKSYGCCLKCRRHVPPIDFGAGEALRALENSSLRKPTLGDSAFGIGQYISQGAGYKERMHRMLINATRPERPHLSTAVVAPRPVTMKSFRGQVSSSMTSILHLSRLRAFQSSLKPSSWNYCISLKSKSTEFRTYSQSRNMVSSAHPSPRAANEFLSFVNASPTRAQFLTTRLAFMGH